MVLCGYLFDAIAINVNLAEGPVEGLGAALIELAFGDFVVKFSSSRMNVSEIPPGKSLEFEEDTDNIRNMLQSAPMAINLSVYGESVGTGIMLWPEEVLRAVEQMGEISYAETIDLFGGDNDDEEAVQCGTIDLLIRFKPKCKNLDEEDFGENFEEVKDEILKEVNSKDLFFVIEDKKHLNECNDDMELPSTPGQPQITLDMTELRNFNGLLVPTPNMLNTCCTDDCCGLKKSAKKYGPKDRIVCGAVNQMKNFKKARKEAKTGKKQKDECLICDTSSDSDDDGSDEDEEEDIGDVQWGGYKPPKVCLHTPPPELTQDIPVRPRCCPVCTMNLDWLPPYVSCPKCGYKPVPKVEQLPYNSTIDASEILKEFYMRDQPSDPIDCRAAVHQPADSDECDCECQKGNTCAHCRVRKACKHIFGKKFDVSAECDNKVPQPALYSEPLQKIFCELKDLLDRTDRLQKQDAFENCSKIFQNKEEKEIKMKIFGDANYNPCKELDLIKEKFSKCKTSYPTCEGVPAAKGRKQMAPEDTAPCSCTKKKRKRGKKCRFPCGVSPLVPKNTVCIPCRKRMVPCKMGWLWTADPYAKNGWRPGAVSRQIRPLMSYFLKNFPPDKYQVRNRCNKPKPEPKPQCPALSVIKRNGIVNVILHPTENKSHPCYGRSNPIIFKIELNDETQRLRSIRDVLLECGYPKCVCLKPVAYCQCRKESERVKLESYLIEESCVQNIPDLEEKIILNDEYDSEAEYNFCVYGPDKVAKRKKMHSVRAPDGIC